MGVFGPEPFDNDNAADLACHLAIIHPKQHTIEGVLRDAIDSVRELNPNPQHHHPDSVSGTVCTGVAALAVVARMATGDGTYTDTAELDDIRTFNWDKLSRPAAQLTQHARDAAYTLLAMQSHPDMPEWDTDATADQHRQVLVTLASQLEKAAAQRAGE